MKTQMKKVEVSVPEELMESIIELRKEIKYNKARPENLISQFPKKLKKQFFRDMNLQVGGELQDVMISRGLGFYHGYNDCRKRHLFLWIDMATINHAYLQYEANLSKENAIHWDDWDKSFICKSELWNEHLKDLLDQISVPDKNAFLQGWCDGVSKFFLSICGLI